MARDARTDPWDVRQAAEAILRFVAGLDERDCAASDVIHLGQSTASFTRSPPASRRSSAA